MTSKELLETLDWDLAIAAANPIEPKDTQKTDYLLRGIARCLKGGKDGKYTKAIEDLSMAISQGPSDLNARYYRACAYYLEGNYERAIADCTGESNKCCPSKIDPKDRYINELLGNIYVAMNDYPKAVNCFKNAIKGYSESEDEPVPSSLLKNFLEVRSGMNRQ